MGALDTRGCGVAGCEPGGGGDAVAGCAAAASVAIEGGYGYPPIGVAGLPVW